MQLAFRNIYLPKHFPLAISRGVSKGTENLFVSVTDKNGVTGCGEMAPGRGAETADAGRDALLDFFDDEVALLNVKEIHHRARVKNVAPCALAALDIALWDLRARVAGLPLYELLKIKKPRAPTSLTLGICTPEIVRERIPWLLNFDGVKSLKIKLGSRDGIDVDQAMFAQVLESTRNINVTLRVDANGGWNVNDALTMMKWLAARGVEYVEQPLLEGAESELPALYKNRPLPVFVDESCRFADDVATFADAVDGVNIKLMKCGGVSGALEIIAAAKKHKLKTMIGCMSESSLSISAAAALSGAIDFIDLDSQLNLNPDPCSGAQLIDGVVMPNDLPGHGAKIKC